MDLEDQVTLPAGYSMIETIGEVSGVNPHLGTWLIAPPMKRKH